MSDKETTYGQLPNQIPQAVYRDLTGKRKNPKKEAGIVIAIFTCFILATIGSTSTISTDQQNIVFLMQETSQIAHLQLLKVRLSK